MVTAKWLVIARNEYRVHTSTSSPGLRRLRPFFPYIVVGLLIFYVAYVSPAFIDLIMDDAVSFLLSGIALATIQIFLFMVSFYLLVIPMMDTLKEAKTGQIEAYLSAPIKPGDVLLGEYLGQVPLYAVLITLLAGPFPAVLEPVGLNAIQPAMVVAIFVLISLSSLWIGTVAAALLRTRLGRASRGRNIGRGLGVLIPLPGLAVTYAMIGGGLLEALADPSTSDAVGTVLGVLPSSWGAKIITGFAANPGEIGALGLEGAMYFTGLILFFVGALWAGSRLAGRVISLEPPSYSAPIAKPGGRLNRALRSLAGEGPSGVIFAGIFKDYIRRLENLTNIVYVLGLFVVLNVFMISESYQPDGPPGHLIMILIYLPVLVAMVTGDEEIWRQGGCMIYRKTPSGVGRYIRAMLVKSWLMSIPLAVAMIAVTSALRPGTTTSVLLVNTLLVALICMAFGPLLLGIYLLNPLFSEKFPKIWFNAMFVIIFSIGLFLISIQVMMGELTIMGLEQTGRVPYILLIQAVASWLAALIALYLGKRKLAWSD